MISDKPNTERFNFLWFFLYALVVVFFMKMIELQIIKYKYYKEISERNRTQIINQAAPRGRILTSDGIVVASNKPTFSLIYFPNSENDVKKIRKFSSFISKWANLDEKEVYLQMVKSQNTLKPVKLAENLSSKTIMYLSELKNFYQGIEIVYESSRYYPYDSFASHLIGYMGKIDSNDWKLYSGDLRYTISSVVGKTGIEKKLEQYLKGTDGGLYMEVDNKGRLVRVIDTKQGLPGSDVKLTINFKVQQAAEKALNNLIYKRGCAIALDPFSGRVIAYAVKPGFNLNFFSDYNENRKKEKIDFDEFNIGIQGTYPPASTFKIITTIAALESGIVSPQEVFYCPGFYNAGDRIFKCWEKKGHKKVDMLKGLANSCDVYYYNVAYKIGPLQIEKTAEQFGIGQKTGIDLPGEKSGNLFGPSIRVNKKSYWFIGDTLNLAIGQGETLVTPMQLAVLISAIASKGEIYKPYYVEEVYSSKEKKIILKNTPQLIRRIKLKEETWQFIYEALREVVMTGTGQAARIKDLNVYGKTGTAQNPHGKDHAWFIAFANYGEERPGIAVSVLVEHGEHGSSAAAPVAKEIIKAFYEDKLSKSDISEEERPTIIE